MKGHKIIYYILVAFVAFTLLLIYIQFNSSKNIENLIAANEEMANEFNVSEQLNAIENNILRIESKVRGFITTKDSSYIEGLEESFKNVNSGLIKLKNSSEDPYSILLIDQLDKLIQQKILFKRQMLNTFQMEGRHSAERLVASKFGKSLTDSIVVSIHRIDSTRKKYLTSTTALIDKSGRKAQQFSTLLILFVLISAAGLFWYIINIIKTQISLIHQLNISEKKVKESAELKEKFMANMSHEIRTPMNAILGFTNLLQRKNIDKESKEYVQTIQSSGESLLTIINDILDLSKIEAGMMRIESAPFSIRELIHSIYTMFKAKADEKNLALLFSVEESIPDKLEGDSTRLTQILINLMGNALKFTDKGKIEIKISGVRTEDNIIKTEITVTDTGIGIEKERLENIFERFQQAEDSVTRRYGGTGLGLAIVKDLVSLQNGSVMVDSELGKGTCFKIIIPYLLAIEETKNQMMVTADPILPSNFEKLRVLVAEDNQINQNLISHLFDEWQLDFDLASNGRHAIEMMQQNNYDLILMDIQMPEMDGYTTAQEIRSRLKSNIPIIAMTAHALAGEKEKCLSYGMNDYISKPIREALLHKLIKKYAEVNLPDNENIKPSYKTEQYQYINLQYMKEISGGNKEYEKTVTDQFIEMVNEEILAIEKAWQDHHISEIKQLAHNMKTTISIMGLDQLLQKDLDALEYEELTEESFWKYFKSINTICEASVEEAKLFYKTF